jgi:hypothetical protein
MIGKWYGLLSYRGEDRSSPISTSLDRLKTIDSLFVPIEQIENFYVGRTSRDSVESRGSQASNVMSVAISVDTDDVVFPGLADLDLGSHRSSRERYAARRLISSASVRPTGF